MKSIRWWPLSAVVLACGLASGRPAQDGACTPASGPIFTTDIGSGRFRPTMAGPPRLRGRRVVGAADPSSHRLHRQQPRRLATALRTSPAIRRGSSTSRDDRRQRRRLQHPADLRRLPKQVHLTRTWRFRSRHLGPHEGPVRSPGDGARQRGSCPTRAHAARRPLQHHDRGRRHDRAAQRDQPSAPRRQQRHHPQPHVRGRLRLFPGLGPDGRRSRQLELRVRQHLDRADRHHREQPGVDRPQRLHRRGPCRQHAADLLRPSVPMARRRVRHHERVGPRDPLLEPLHGSRQDDAHRQQRQRGGHRSQPAAGHDPPQLLRERRAAHAP
jgi:hypothetical protein